MGRSVAAALGGVTVLDVLARTHSDPPVDGADGLLVGFGPGFVTAACRGTWRSEPALAPLGVALLRGRVELGERLSG
jgi:hypothetical protein